MAERRIPVSVKEAKEQAADYFGFTASTFIQIEGGKVFEIPNPGLMDDDQQERWEELQFQVEKCDRHPDVVIDSTTVTDSNGTTTTVPPYTAPGDIMIPHRIDGGLLKPSYNVRLAIALWGEEGYEEYKKGGGIANQIGLEWARMNREYQERLKTDSKSTGSGPALEIVRSTD